MSYQCGACHGLVLEGDEKRQSWGYGGKWCNCARPVPSGTGESGISWLVRAPEADRQAFLEEVMRKVGIEMDRKLAEWQIKRGVFNGSSERGA